MVICRPESVGAGLWWSDVQSDPTHNIVVQSTSFKTPFSHSFRYFLLAYHKISFSFFLFISSTPLDIHSGFSSITPYSPFFSFFLKDLTQHLQNPFSHSFKLSFYDYFLNSFLFYSHLLPSSSK